MDKETEDTLNTLRVECKRSLFFLARAILKYSDLDPDIHLPICRMLQNYQQNTRRMIVFPRTWFKSTIGSIAYPIWRAINNPNVRLLIAQNTMTNAKKKIASIKAIWESNGLLRAMFPELLPRGDRPWSSECLTLNRSLPEPEGTFEPAGTGTAVTSRHYDEVIQDDTVAPDYDAMTGEIQQPTQMEIEKAIGFHKMCHPLLLHPTKSAITVIGTRWAQEDLIGWIFKHGRRYTVVSRSAREDKDSIPATPEQGGKPIWDRFNDDVLDEIEASIGQFMFCTPGYASVLMSDWSSKPIKDVLVGDTVVGLKLHRSESVKTKVTAKGSRASKMVKVTMFSGRVVFCTPDHKWLADRKHWKIRPKLTYRKPEFGNTSYFVCEPNVPVIDNKLALMAAWLGGIYDGEGTCTLEQRRVSISQTSHNSAVQLSIKNALDALGIANTGYVTERSDTKHSALTTFVLHGRDARRKFLHYTKPIRSDDIRHSLFGCNAIDMEDNIVKIEPAGEDIVYWIETETGNYVSQGYVSKNSMLYMNSPTSAVNQVFKRSYINYYDNLPKNLLYFTSIDPAPTDSAAKSLSADYNVVISCALRPSTGEVWVVHYNQMRCDPGELIDRLFDHWRAYKPLVTKVESTAYQKTLMYWITRRQEQLNQRFYIEGVPNAKTSKVARILGLQPWFAAGKIHIKEEHRDLERELLSFDPNKKYGGHDDIIDALSFQVGDWTRSCDTFQEEAAVEQVVSPFSGKLIINELLDRVDEPHKYPYDIGNMFERVEAQRLRDDYEYAGRRQM